MARPTPNNPTGAQVKYKQTPETLIKLEEAFAIDASVPEACMFAGISQNCYYEWIKDNPKLGERFAELRQKPVLKARNVIVKNLENPEVSKWYLERKAKGEFAQRSEVTGAGGVSLVLTPEEKEEIAKVFPNAKDNG